MEAKMTNITTLENKVNAFIALANIKKILMEGKLIFAAQEACRKEGRDYVVADPYNEENWEE